MSSRRKATLFIFLSLVVLDQLTKYVLLSVGFEVIKNAGVSFGLWPSGGWIWGVGIVLAGIILMLRKDGGGPVSTMLIVAGGLSNFLDRLFLGYVRDWIILPISFLPAFNLADVFIDFGIIMIVFDIFRKRRL